MRSVRDQRESLIQQFFPDGMPNLWCPAITHVKPDGSFDVQRMETLLGRVADFATGWLMFGPTGSGDQLSDDDVISLLPFVCRTAIKHDSVAFISATCKTVDECVRRAELVIDWVRENRGQYANQSATRSEPLNPNG